MLAMDENALPEQAWSLDEPVQRIVPAFTGLVAAAELTIPQIPIFAEQASTDLMRLADAHRVPIIAAPVFIYTGQGTGTNDSFLLQIALPVPEEVDIGDAQSQYATKGFDELRCLCFDYHGSMHHLGQAYPLAMTALKDAGHTPIEQTREVYKRWIAYDSPENVTEIQLGIV